MHKECSRMFQKLHKLKWSYISFHAGLWACVQFPELTWSSMSLHEVSRACMQFHELVCSSFLCLNSSQEFRSACLHLELITTTTPSWSWLKVEGSGLGGVGCPCEFSDSLSLKILTFASEFGLWLQTQDYRPWTLDSGLRLVNQFENSPGMGSMLTSHLPQVYLNILFSIII